MVFISMFKTNYTQMASLFLLLLLQQPCTNAYHKCRKGIMSLKTVKGFVVVLQMPKTVSCMSFNRHLLQKFVIFQMNIFDPF